MDCTTCRNLFSESFDGRLAGERRQAFLIHVQVCGGCEREFALYRRVFSTIRGLPDGEARPFQAPAEVPGALTSTPSRFAVAPRFARVAAGILILIGLVGSHVILFQAGLSHGGRGSDSQGIHDQIAPAPPIAASMISSPLPALLRDHVDATDLFVRTASQLPDDAVGRDVVRADWAASKLPQLTDELRRSSFELSPERRAIVDRYLDDSEDFVRRLRPLLEDHEQAPVPVTEVRDRATLSRLVLYGGLESMKPLVAALPRGRSFSARPARALMLPLGPDGRLLIESKQARLAGDMPVAIAGFRKFNKEFQGSPLTPAATLLQFDSLAAAGQWADAVDVLQRVPQCGSCSTGLTEALGRMKTFFVARPMAMPAGIGFRWTDTSGSKHRIELRMSPQTIYLMKSEFALDPWIPPLPPAEEPPRADAPRR